MRVARIKILGETLGRALEELQSRDFGLTSLRDLIALINHLEARLMREGVGIQYTADQQALQWERRPKKIELFDQN